MVVLLDLLLPTMKVAYGPMQSQSRNSILNKYTKVIGIPWDIWRDFVQ